MRERAVAVQRKKKNLAPPKAPSWMITFADMMSLLMCFFVLLLANAETDIMKFRLIAGSMSKPSGPAIQAEMEPGAAPPKHDEAFPEPPSESEWDGKVQKIKETLAPDIVEGVLDVEGGDNTVTFRIKEAAGFPSGRADATERFASLVERIGEVLKENDGRVVIAGHTDDRPIYNMLYRSNWDLSSARAVTVAHHLIDVVGLPLTRLEVRGYGASRPLVPNDSDKNRATNRRVEVVMTDGPTQARKPPGLRNSKDGRHYEG